MTIRLSRQFGFGPARTTPGGPGGRQGGGGGRGGGGAAQQVQGPGGPGGPGGGAGNPFGANQRFSAELWISANNVLNRVNYLNFVGNIQSPFFGTATSAAPPRRIEVGVNFRF
jgi:hypothetical protein